MITENKVSVKTLGSMLCVIYFVGYVITNPNDKEAVMQEHDMQLYMAIPLTSKVSTNCK